MENEPERNLADDFEHWPNEPATRNDLRILATRIDHRFERIDSRFGKIDSRFDRIDVQFDRIDSQFDRIDSQFNRIDSQFNRIDVQFQSIQTMIKKELLDFKESMRKEMFRFAGFLTISGLSALGIFAAIVR